MESGSLMPLQWCRPHDHVAWTEIIKQIWADTECVPGVKYIRIVDRFALIGDNKEGLKGKLLGFFTSPTNWLGPVYYDEDNLVRNTFWVVGWWKSSVEYQEWSCW